MQTISENSVALIFGANGGLGAAFVHRLLAHTQVGLVWAATRDPGSEMLQALQDQYGERIRPVAVDITDEQALAALAAQVGEITPRLHLLINAFGFLHDAEARIRPEKRLEDLSADGLMQNFAVNAMAPALIARAFIGLLSHQERAVYASLSARVGSITDNRLGGWYAYRMSKAAQNMFTRGLAIESGRRAKQLISLALHPGTTDTALSEPFQSRVPDGKLFTPEFAAGKLLDVIDGAGIEDSGRFLAWDGEPIPW